VQSSGWPAVVTCVANWFGKGRLVYILVFIDAFVVDLFLCGRPVGHIMHHAHLSFHPSLHLSHVARNSKTRKCRKVKIDVVVPHWARSQDVKPPKSGG